VIGDIAADVQAARAAGARAVLVPDARTLATELIGTRMARDVLSAVHMVTRDLPLAPVWPGRAQ
jgi:beta-phosphoglucomutase-like phosphatase (HAD superfamily)